MAWGRLTIQESLAHIVWGMRSIAPSGFTLIELSIVLVIIGLIVGGVLVDITRGRGILFQNGIFLAATGLRVA